MRCDVFCLDEKATRQRRGCTHALARWQYCAAIEGSSRLSPSPVLKKLFWSHYTRHTSHHASARTQFSAAGPRQTQFESRWALATR
eukprot:366226-Chlamydomonas_euryale.AAC.8